MSEVNKTKKVSIPVRVPKEPKILKKKIGGTGRDLYQAPQEIGKNKNKIEYFLSVEDSFRRFQDFMIDQYARGTAWEAAYVNGWIVTGDLSRGLDVLRLR
mgnify:CR=1 FL=1